MLKIFLLQVAIICGGSGKYVIFVTVYRVAVAFERQRRGIV